MSDNNSSTMRAVEITRPGDASVLSIVQRPVPMPGPGEIRIKVSAAGINRPDILQRRGFYPPPDGVTDIPGLEVAGEIDALGDGANGNIKTPIMALLPGGGYAEYAIVRADHILPVPAGISMVEAAGLPETMYTVWANVFESGGLCAEQTLFVHGATSGIGTTAAAMANAAGAIVYGTAGTKEKTETAEAHGYKKCFHYRDDDWSAKMAEIGGADVVLDMVGGDYVPKNLALMKAGGRHVSIAVQGGMNATINMFDIMRRRLTLTGSTLRARPNAEKARLTRAVAQHVLPWITAGDVRPMIGGIFALEDAADAHTALEAGAAGKIILTL